MIEIYSVGNLDLKFDAKQALGCEKNSSTIVGFCYTHTHTHMFTQYIS